jgi:hypothetical protein
MMSLNLLFTNEYKFFCSLFDRCFPFLKIKVVNAENKKLTENQIKNAVQLIFVFSVHILHYCMFKNFQDLKLEEFLNKLDDERHVLVPKNIVIITVNFLLTFCLAVSSNPKAASFSEAALGFEETTKNNLTNFKAFILKIKAHVITNNQDFQFTIHQSHNYSQQTILPVRLFYTYRLTYNDKKQNKTMFYMGVRGCATSAKTDVNYFSSGKAVKQIIKKEGSQNFTKKILGVYCSKVEAYSHEIRYHKILDVAKNERFLNLANQTHLYFSFDVTGKSLMSQVGRASLSNYQRNVRVRTAKEREELSISARKRNAKTAICPHCGVKGQFTAMKRWHFDRCSKNPDISPSLLAEVKAAREKIRQSAIKRNKSRIGKPNVQAPVTCPHCGVTGRPGAMRLHHFDNCVRKK